MLYKFRYWKNCYHRNLIRKRELFFSSIKGFNDPFDSNIPINYGGLSKEEQIEIVTDHVEHNYPTLAGDEKERKIKECLEAAVFDDPEKLKKKYQNEVKPIKEQEFGILSLADNRESILMWSHYACSHTGFCVGFDEDKLQDYANNFGSNNEFIIMLPVSYKKEYPDFNPLNLNTLEYAIEPLLVKSTAWCYEGEIRLIYVNGSDKKVVFPKELFSEVILGCNICEKERSALIKSITSNFVDLPIFQAKLADKKFALEFEKITPAT